MLGMIKLIAISVVFALLIEAMFPTLVMARQVPEFKTCMALDNPDGTKYLACLDRTTDSIWYIYPDLVDKGYKHYV